MLRRALTLAIISLLFLQTFPLSFPTKLRSAPTSASFIAVPASPSPPSPSSSSSSSSWRSKLSLLYQSEALQRSLTATAGDAATTEASLLSFLRINLLAGGYKPFTGDDLALCSCLNPGYLLRLSLEADFTGLTSINKEFEEVSELFDGVVAVFVRGYDTEVTEGRMICQKLDYLQSNLLSSLPGLSTVANRTKATYKRYNVHSLIVADGVASMAPYVTVPNATLPSQQEMLSRVSISDECDIFSDGGRKRLLRSLFKKSTLVEPTYKEVIVVHRPEPLQEPRSLPQSMLNRVRRTPRPTTQSDVKVTVFCDVPLANFVACLPKSKLVFKAQEAIRLDVISVLGLFAALATLKFDSPYADALAVAALVVWGVRLALRRLNSLARYDLLVNRFLQKKIVRRGLGEVAKYVASNSAERRGEVAARALEWLNSGEQGLKDKYVVEGFRELKALGLDEDWTDGAVAKTLEERWKRIYND